MKAGQYFGARNKSGAWLFCECTAAVGDTIEALVTNGAWRGTFEKGILTKVEGRPVSYGDASRYEIVHTWAGKHKGRPSVSNYNEAIDFMETEYQKQEKSE